MLLKKLTLTNFKGFSHKEISLNKKNYVEGKNGEGKSTIKDAVFFCFYNRTSEGSLSESTNYIYNGADKATVEIEFEKDGETFVVKRERNQSSTRISLLDGSQSEEDSTIAQRELDGLVPDYQLMQVVFNVGYFMQLSDKEKRDFILRLTPETNYIELFKQLGGKEDDLKNYGLTFSSIKASHEKLLRLRRENQITLDSNNAIIADSKEIIIPVATIEMPDMEALEKHREEATVSANEWYAYNLQKDRNERCVERNKEIEKEIAKLKWVELVEPSQDTINKLIAEKSNVERIQTLPEGTCPTCLQKISLGHKAIVAKNNSKVAANVQRLEKRISAERAQYETYLGIWKENEEIKKRVQTLEAQLIEPVELVEPKEKITFNKEAYEKAKDQLNKFVSENAEIRMLTQQEEARKEKIKELRELNQITVQHINDLNRLIEIFSPKGLPRLEMENKLGPILDKIRKILPTASIELVEDLKNGLDTKEVFKVVVGGIEYDKLSHGQKMLVDTSLSQIIDEMSGYQIGVYCIDNAESISSPINIREQFIVCKVSSGPLKIS